MTAAVETYDVFISYSRADGRHAAGIDSALRDKGLRPFFDRRNLDPGLPWVRALEKAIDSAKSAIVLIGPHGFGNTQQYERELAIIRQIREPAFRVVPVILPKTGSDLPFDFLQNLTWLDFSQVEKVSDAPDELERLLRAVQGGPTAGDEARQVICPWRGLDAFREEGSAFFFGRGSVNEPDSPIGQLVRKVRERPFVMVVGRSGSGKSSLVFAGLVPALRRDRSRFWNVLTLRPGPSPLRALAAAFNPPGENDGAAGYETKISQEVDQLRTGDLDLLGHMIGRQLDGAEGKPDRLLLYIDQWEELYAQVPFSSDKEQATEHAGDVTRFIDLLLTAARTAPVTVVGTVRADFYDPLIGHPEVRSLLPARQVLLARMSRSELESTIVEPAKKVGLDFDPPGLVQRILDEAGEDEGMLPLLQYALKESWALRKGRTTTADSYARSGGVREAIRVTAEREFEALSAADQQAARQLFLQLVTPGEGQEDTRARAAMPSEPAQRRIVEQFAGPRTRLLVTGSDSAARPVVEVAHEALIRKWPRLREWIDANREKLRTRAAVVQAKAEWEHHGRRDDLLLSPGFQLERARELMKDSGDLNTDDIQEFVARSSEREEIERKEKEATLEREKAQVARTASWQRITRWALATVGAVILIAVAIVAYLQRDKEQQLATTARELVVIGQRVATKEKELEESGRQLATKKKALTVAGLQLTAIRRQVAAAEKELDESVRELATKEKALTVAELQLTAIRQQVAAEEKALTAAELLLDETRASVSMERANNAALTDSLNKRQLEIDHAQANLLGELSGAKRLAGELDSALRLASSGTRIDLALPPGAVKASSATAALAVAVSQANWRRVLAGHERNVTSAAFSPDGTRIVTASGDKTARIWDAATAKEIAVLRGHDGFVTSAAFSPDGTRIVTASADKTARIWDAATAKEIAVLRGHDGFVTSAAFSPDGTRIVTASWDKTARLWDAATAKEIAVLRHEQFVASAAFSPDGGRIVTAAGDKTPRLWDAATAKEIAVLRGHDGFVTSAAFSPDGTRIVTAAGDKTARIWDSRREMMPAIELLMEMCARLPGLTKLTRDEMRLAGYPDSRPEIDVCKEAQR